MKKNIREKLYERLPNLKGAELGNVLQYIDNERKLLNSVFNLLQEAILLVDESGSIVFSNAAAGHFLGLAQDNKQPAPLWHWLPALKSFFETKNKAFSPDVLSKEMDLVYPDHRWVRSHIQNFPENRNGIRFIVILQDITQETQESEERILKERVDSVVQLASEVAHELGNPLNSIGIHLQLLQRSLDSTNTKAVHSLQVCQSEIRRLDEIVQHFLQAVRPKSVSLQKCNIIPIIKKVLSLLKPQLSDLNISIDLNVQNNLPYVFLDPARVHQALFNIIKNAIEAIGTNGWIKISCYSDDCYLIVGCADSGNGISGDQARHMTSLQNVTTKASGHGIGMLIVQRVMREHNGCVDIESKQRCGSIVYLKFPLPERILKQLPNQQKH